MWCLPGNKEPVFFERNLPCTTAPDADNTAKHGTADKLLNDRLAAPFTADANDVLYQWDSSRDYNPAPGLDRIQATVLAINSADDEKNPPETGIMERELKRVKGGRLFLIPGSEDTSGHGTVFFAKFWKQQVQELLQTTPRRAM